MSPRWVLRRPRPRRMRKTGMSVTWLGTIIVSTSRVNSRSRRGKATRAKA
jgi:hypothetical protein